jgi:hypothetical protein
VLQVAAQTGCVAVGVEIRSELTSIGQALLKNYQTLVRAILSGLDKLVRTLRSHDPLSSCEEPTSCEEKCNSCVGTF